ncbi:sigma-70 family RNA polymerase sigma factor [Streptomyces sp. NPDC046374]|uniref:sigma-70 family RNA polymerase sigma factor n=1 Tax=Streptomyces sp. NPDC046374 TaxID=3154917 RepID=UPI0033F0DE19
MSTELPAPFAALAETLGAETTVEQARLLGQALNSVPALQKWLREQRQATFRGLLDGQMTKEELAPHVELSAQRCADIASGHLNTAARARSRKAG